jgi:hypothetical protein
VNCRFWQKERKIRPDQSGSTQSVIHLLMQLRNARLSSAPQLFFSEQASIQEGTPGVAGFSYP